MHMGIFLRDLVTMVESSPGLVVQDSGPHLEPLHTSPHEFTLQVVTDLAGYHPFPRILHDHFCCEEGSWKQVDHICPVPSGDEGVAIEIDGMDVYLIPHPKQVPGHRFSNTHLRLRHVSKKESIEG